jgi:hypothetical protein
MNPVGAEKQRQKTKGEKGRTIKKQRGGGQKKLKDKRGKKGMNKRGGTEDQGSGT